MRLKTPWTGRPRGLSAGYVKPTLQDPTGPAAWVPLLSYLPAVAEAGPRLGMAAASSLTWETLPPIDNAAQQLPTVLNARPQGDRLPQPCQPPQPKAGAPSRPSTWSAE